MKKVIPTAIAISFGILVLAGFIFPQEQFLLIRGLVTDWAVLVSALAILLGIFKLILGNWSKIRGREKGWGYDLLTILALVSVLVIYPMTTDSNTTVLHTTNITTKLIFSGIINAGQASLAAIAVIFTVAAVAQYLPGKKNLWGFLFTTSFLFVLFTWVPLGVFSRLAGLREWFMAIPATAGLRGILIGTGLGTVFMGIRYLLGLERVHEEKDSKS